jgi:hypothetical protein
MEEGTGVISPKARRRMVIGNDVKLLSFRVADRKYRMKWGQERRGGWVGFLGDYMKE